MPNVIDELEYVDHKGVLIPLRVVQEQVPELDPPLRTWRAAKGLLILAVVVGGLILLARPLLVQS